MTWHDGIDPHDLAADRWDAHTLAGPPDPDDGPWDDDPPCENVVDGQRCGHPVSAHTFGGMCRLCPCKDLTTKED